MNIATRPVEAFIQQAPIAPREAPARQRTTWRQALFGDLASSIVTLVVVAVAVTALPRLLHWAVVAGVWSGGPEACRVGEGACWSFLRAKYPQILFGIYPPAEQWRPMAVVALFVGLTLWTMPVRNWTRGTLYAWIGGTAAALLVMSGGVFGLEHVPTTAWGGLPITILLTVLSLGLGFPFALLLALGRRSALPVVRALSVGFIEIVRGLPLLSMLFIASLLLPIMLPEGITIDNLFRALVALGFYAAAYLAEVLRGGLQSLPSGQQEAARALGLGRVQTLRLVVVPQAIRAVIPPLTNTAVVIVKNTSLVLVVGLFDLLSSGRAAAADPDWPTPYAETYLFIALIYFVICFGISRYSLFLERRMTAGVRR